MQGPETVECANCGTDIRLNAEVCHNCGADNESRPGRSISAPHDPSKIETTVSGKWYYGITLCLVLWVLSFLLSGIVDSLAAIFILIAWAGLPLSTYFDMQYIRANSKWNPSTISWTVGLIIPVLNIVVGGAYLYRRYETIGLA